MWAQLWHTKRVSCYENKSPTLESSTSLWFSLLICKHYRTRIVALALIELWGDGRRPGESLRFKGYKLIKFAVDPPSSCSNQTALEVAAVAAAVRLEQLYTSHLLCVCFQQSSRELAAAVTLLLLLTKGNSSSSRKGQLLLCHGRMLRNLARLRLLLQFTVSGLHWPGGTTMLPLVWWPAAAAGISGLL